MVLNPNENYLEVEKPSKSSPLPSPTDPLDEPAEKRERKDDKEGKKKREFYEKYRNPQKETETERIPIRVCCRRREGCRDGVREERQKDRCTKVDVMGEVGRLTRSCSFRVMGEGRSRHR